jgi:RNA-binding protein YlmH
LQHYPKNEQPYVEKVIGWCEYVFDKRTVKHIGFTDPRQADIIEQITNHYDEVGSLIDGGYDDAERKYVSIFHTMSDFDYVNPYSVIEVRYAKKFYDLKHKDLLGALMNLGIAREKFGDIIVDDELLFFVETDFIPYLKQQLVKVGRASVELKEKNTYDINIVKEIKKEKVISVRSLRLDNIVAKAYNLSRNSVKDLILSGHVKVNHQVMTNFSYIADENDLISLRKHGRVQLAGIVGESRKGNVILKILK